MRYGLVFKTPSHVRPWSREAAGAVTSKSTTPLKGAYTNVCTYIRTYVRTYVHTYVRMYRLLPEDFQQEYFFRKRVENVSQRFEALLVQACTSLCKLVQACTSLYKLVQACTSLYKLVQATLRNVAKHFRHVSGKSILVGNLLGGACTYVRMYVRTYVRTYVCTYIRSYKRPLRA